MNDSTGLGIGHQITSYIDVKLELKFLFFLILGKETVFLSFGLRSSFVTDFFQVQKYFCSTTVPALARCSGANLITIYKLHGN